jgi:hypothetical protein
MKNLIATLKGLFWFYKYSERIIVPFNKEGWKTLLGVASSWQYVFPEPIQYGSCLYLSLEELMTEKACNYALELLEYQRKHTEQRLAGYCMFPTGPWTKIECNAPEDIGAYRTLGWKQEYEWRPMC